MLFGGFDNTIDSKGRIFFPTKLREEFGEKFMICRGVEKCLMLFPMDKWEDFAAKIAALPFSKARSMQRFFFTYAAECSVDTQGRLLIPQNLREYAGLEKDTITVGAQNRAEIWSAAEWKKIMDNTKGEDIAEMMDEIGF